MGNVVKFPFNACRRVHSRKQRRSKYGTPEERAAKLAAAKARVANASVVENSGRSGPNQRLAKASVADPPFLEFLRQLGGYIVKEFATGKEIDEIFDELIAEARQTGRRR
jgi:hypothetical protein